MATVALRAAKTARELVEGFGELTGLESLVGGAFMLLVVNSVLAAMVAWPLGYLVVAPVAYATGVGDLVFLDQGFYLAAAGTAAIMLIAAEYAVLFWLRD